MSGRSVFHRNRSVINVTECCLTWCWAAPAIFICFHILIPLATYLLWLHVRSICFPPQSNASQYYRMCFNVVRSSASNFHVFSYIHSRFNVFNLASCQVDLFFTTIDRFSVSQNVFWCGAEHPLQFSSVFYTFILASTSLIWFKIERFSMSQNVLWCGK